MVSSIVKKTVSFSKEKGLNVDPQDNISPQSAPDFSNDAQKDRESIEEIRENTEEIDVNVNVQYTNPEDDPNFQGQ